MAFKERDDPMGDARMKNQSALNDRKVGWDPESGDKHTWRRINIRT